MLRHIAALSRRETPDLDSLAAEVHAKFQETGVPSGFVAGHARVY